jgi:hypothetical protein
MLMGPWSNLCDLRSHSLINAKTLIKHSWSFVKMCIQYFWGFINFTSSVMFLNQVFRFKNFTRHSTLTLTTCLLCLSAIPLQIYIFMSVIVSIWHYLLSFLYPLCMSVPLFLPLSCVVLYPRLRALHFGAVCVCLNSEQGFVVLKKFGRYIIPWIDNLTEENP